VTLKPYAARNDAVPLRAHVALRAVREGRALARVGRIFRRGGTERIPPSPRGHVGARDTVPARARVGCRRRRRSLVSSNCRFLQARRIRPRQSAPRSVRRVSTSWLLQAVQLEDAGPGRDDDPPVESHDLRRQVFTFILKTPPAARSSRRRLGLEKGSGQPNRDKVARRSPGRRCARSPRSRCPTSTRALDAAMADDRRHRALHGRGGEGLMRTARSTGPRPAGGRRSATRRRRRSRLVKGGAFAKFDETVDVAVNRLASIRGTRTRSCVARSCSPRARQDGARARDRPG
jgi:hypothetical protein